MYFVYVKFKSKLNSIQRNTDHLSEKNLPIKQMNLGPSNNGMSEAELTHVENTLNKKIPSFYRTFLENYPDELVMLNDESNMITEYYLQNKADKIIELDAYESVPKHVLVISQDGGGNFHFLNLEFWYYL